MTISTRAYSDGTGGAIQVNGTDVVSIYAGVTRPLYTNTATVAAGNSFTFNPVTYGQICLISCTGAGTITFAAPTNIIEGAPYTFLIKATDTSVRLFAWNVAYQNNPYTYGTTALNKIDVFHFIGGASNTLIYAGGTIGV